MTSHLTHEQLCDLLLSGQSRDAWVLSSPELDAARDHIQECKACSEEFATLSDSMQLFRSTADSWSSQEWSRKSLVQASTLKPVTSGSRLRGLFRQPLLWGASAAALAIAVAIPFTLHRMDNTAGNDASISTPSAYTKAVNTQSDEALLEEINQTLSSSVPSPMQPLADPTDQASQTQRKN
jgi:hypothetical protein